MKGEESNIEEILIAKYLSGEATSDETEQLTQWLEADLKHRHYFSQLVNVWQTANPAFNPNEIDAGEACRRVTDKLKFNKKRARLIVLFNRAAAVLFIPLLIVAAYLLQKSTSRSDTVVYQEINAPYGTYSQVVLPDGSLVSINAGSKLKFPTLFPKGEREVYLDGEGYFEVVSSQKRPFIVHTEKLTVRATGTKFNVEDYRKDTIAAVTMIEGIIHTTVSGSRIVPQSPGDRLLFSKTSGMLQQLKTDPYKWYAWKDGTLIFRDDPLEYVFKRLNQTFNVNIIIKDTQLVTHPYRATFTDESLEEIMHLLKMSAPIYFKEIDRDATEGEYRDRRTIEVYFEDN